MPEKKCADYDKEGVQKTPHAVQLYHATTDADSVCREGLKTRKESGKTGLGGGTDKLVSFTTDPTVAKDIASDLQTVIRIARGDVHMGNICQYLERHDSAPGQKMTPCEIWKAYEKGGTFNPFSGGLYARKEYFDNLREGHVFRGGRTPSGEYTVTYSKGTPEEVRERLLEFYRTEYLSRRSFLRGRPDPIFFWGRAGAMDFASLDPEKVGIVEVTGYLPFPAAELKKMRSSEIYEKTRKFGGIEIMDSMGEIRLAKNRFDNLRVRDDLL